MMCHSRVETVKPSVPGQAFIFPARNNDVISQFRGSENLPKLATKSFLGVKNDPLKGFCTLKCSNMLLNTSTSNENCHFSLWMAEKSRDS
jgi:hypothetical protein